MTHSCWESDPDVLPARAAASLPFLAKNVRPRADPEPPPLILRKRGKGTEGLGPTGVQNSVLVRRVEAGLVGVGERCVPDLETHCL